MRLSPPLLRRLTERRSRRFLVAAAIFLGTALVLLPRFLSLNLPYRGPGTAEFYFYQPRERLLVNQSFPIEVHVKTSGRAINAASVRLKFDPRRLEILNINTERSFCSLYAENSFDTINGEVDVACGTPAPGFEGDSTLVIVTARAKFPGTSTVTMVKEESSILANDGHGSNIARTLPTLEVTTSQSF